jgi:hypothetical protein
MNKTKIFALRVFQVISIFGIYYSLKVSVMALDVRILTSLFWSLVSLLVFGFIIKYSNGRIAILRTLAVKNTPGAKLVFIQIGLVILMVVAYIVLAFLEIELRGLQILKG